MLYTNIIIKLILIIIILFIRIINLVILKYVIKCNLNDDFSASTVCFNKVQLFKVVRIQEVKNVFFYCFIAL